MDTREDIGEFYPGGTKVPQGPITPKEPVTSYNELSDRPQINGKTLTKDSTAAGLGLSEEGHKHAQSDIEGLELSWDKVTGKPSEFNPTKHEHLVGEIEGLPTQLKGIETDLKTAQETADSAKNAAKSAADAAENAKKAAEEAKEAAENNKVDVDTTNLIEKVTANGNSQTIKNGLEIEGGEVVNGGLTVKGGLLDVSKAIVTMTPPEGTVVVTTDEQIVTPGPAAWIGDGIALKVISMGGVTLYSDFVTFRSLMEKLNSLKINIDGRSIQSTQKNGIATLAFDVDSDVFAYDDKQDASPVAALAEGDEEPAPIKPRLRFKLKGEIEQMKSVLDALESDFTTLNDKVASISNRVIEEISFSEQIHHNGPNNRYNLNLAVDHERDAAGDIDIIVHLESVLYDGTKQDTIYARIPFANVMAGRTTFVGLNDVNGHEIYGEAYIENNGVYVKIYCHKDGETENVYDLEHLAEVTAEPYNTQTFIPNEFWLIMQSKYHRDQLNALIYPRATIKYTMSAEVTGEENDTLKLSFGETPSSNIKI